jgi:glycosyltransferase involved in cell wall biosynthesis
MSKMALTSIKQTFKSMHPPDLNISVVLPCRNEEAALGQCIKTIKQVFDTNNINGEIIVSDSSTDLSPQIAKDLGARLVKHDQQGYGIAYLEGFKEAKGKYIFLGDADNTYDFNEIPRFIKYLDGGYDFVIGDRFAGEMKKDAMPWSHKYIGNPILSSLFRLFFKTKINDIHCGMRAITRSSLDKLNLRTTGMEFASEMVIRSIQVKLKIKELPIDYHKRSGRSKLNPITDAWRHIRFMLLYSPLFLFFIPGIILFVLGLAILTSIYLEITDVIGLSLQYHPMFAGSLLTIAGYQLTIFAIFAKTYAMTHLGEKSSTMDNLHQHLTIEKASLLGMLIILTGTAIYIFIFFKWANNNFGALEEVKNSIIALTLIIIGIQTISSSFMLSVLGIKEKL